MKYAAIHRDFMNRPPALGASCAARGAWMSVLVYASDLETDLLEGCHGWDDRMWLTACGVALEDVGAAVGAGLLVWENDGSDLRVLGFDHAGLRAIESKRAAGKFGAMGGRPKNPMGSDSETPSPPPSQPFRTEYQIAFERVWEKTGRHGSKFAASTAWAKVGKPIWEDIEAAYAAYLKSERPVSGYVQDLSTWLNKRGHTQEWPEATKAPHSATGSATRTSYCPFHEQRFNYGKRSLRPTPTCPACKEWEAANRARESMPETSEMLIKRLGLDHG